LEGGGRQLPRSPAERARGEEPLLPGRPDREPLRADVDDDATRASGVERLRRGLAREKRIDLPRVDVVHRAAEALTRVELAQTGEDRRLRDRQLLNVAVEELARRRGDAVRAAAEVDLVQVEVEDVVLAELRFEPQREDELLHLPLVAPLRGQQELLHDLLRDR